jgi:hypothetical protein
MSNNAVQVPLTRESVMEATSMASWHPTFECILTDDTLGSVIVPGCGRHAFALRGQRAMIRR